MDKMLKSRLTVQSTSMIRCLMLMRLKLQKNLKCKTTYPKNKYLCENCIQCAKYWSLYRMLPPVLKIQYQMKSKQSYKCVNVVSYCGKVYNDTKTLIYKRTTNKNTEFNTRPIDVRRPF